MLNRIIKSVLVSILIFINADLLHAQVCNGSIFSEDYTSSTGWTWSSITNQGGDITIAGGTANFNAVQDDGYCRIIKKIPVLPATWTAQCSFVASAGNSTGHSIMDFTSNSDDPISQDRTGGFAQTDNHVIGVIINGILNPNGDMNSSTKPTTPNAEWYFYALIKRGAQPIKLSTGIPVPALDKVYYISLQRTAPSTGLISVFSDSLMTTHIPKSPQCFTIDEGIQNLSFLQQGAITFGNFARVLTAKIDNVKICPYTSSSSISLTGDTSFCKGTPLTFTGKATGGSTQTMWELMQCNSQGTITANGYTWSSGWLNSPPGAYTFPATVNPPCDNYYRVKFSVKDGGACFGSSETSKIIHLDCNGKFIQGIWTTAISCYGGNDGKAAVFMDRINAPYTYKWLPAVSTKDTATGLGLGKYTVFVTDKNGCVAIESIEIGQNPLFTIKTSTTPTACGEKNGTATADATDGFHPPYTYSWNTVPVQTTATATGLGIGTYTVTVANEIGCKQNAIVIIGGSSVLELTTSATNANCDNPNGTASVTAKGGTGMYTYSWNTNPVQTTATAINLSAGTYSVTVTDSKGCLKTATITVSKDAGGPKVNFTASNACPDDSVIFKNLSSTGLPCYWKFGDNQTSTEREPSHLYAQPGNYTVKLIVGTTAGCLDSISKVITVYPRVLPIITADNVTGCSPLNVTFSNSSTPIEKYEWSFGDKTTSTLPTPAHVYVNNGKKPISYTVKLNLISRYGCSSELTLTNFITVNPGPSAGFTTAPNNVDELSPVINFYNRSTGAISYKWMFGDGDTSEVEDPTHVFATAGRYTTCLVATSQNDCKDTSCNNVLISPVSSFYIPNAFTPNNDGDNDIFMGYGSNISAYQMDIYDRWGNHLFKTTDLLEGWTGRVKGSNEIVPQDTYVYRVELKYESSRKRTFIGSVTVIK
jgi:gliding motility-associated-like protein